MQFNSYHVDKERYAKCIEVSKQTRWDIDNDVIRGREFDFSQKFLPDGISIVDQLDFLSRDEKRLLSKIQGRTYGNLILSGHRPIKDIRFLPVNKLKILSFIQGGKIKWKQSK